MAEGLGKYIHIHIDTLTLTRIRIIAPKYVHLGIEELIVSHFNDTYRSL